MDSQNPQVNRWLVAVLAVVCLFSGITIAVVDTPNNMWCGGFVRVGVLLSVLWFCLPSKGRPAAWANFSPWWLLGIVPLLIMVRRPVVLVPLVIVLVFLGAIIPMFTRPRK